MRYPSSSSHDQEPFFSSRGPEAVQTKEEEPFFQAKFTIGKANDKFEKEADHVADKVVQRLATPLEDENFSTNDERMKRDRELREKPEVQQKEEPETTTSSLANRIDSSRGHGSPLPTHTLSEMQSSFGHDFSGVKIHTDTESINMNRELGAQAFTHGSDIYFNTGKFNPDSSTGKHLLAHELTHVVQQNATTEAPGTQRKEAKHRKPTTSKFSPDISEATYQEAQTRIHNKDFAGAFQIVMQDLITSGKVDPLLFTYKFVDDTTQGEGETTNKKYKKDPETGKYAPVAASGMTIFTKAFTSPQWLVSTILHEYQHVLQQQRPVDHEEIVPEKRGGKSGEFTESDEVEAYLWELEHLDETGLKTHPASIRLLFRLLTDHYDSLGQYSPTHQALYKTRYDAAVRLLPSAPQGEEKSGKGYKSALSGLWAPAKQRIIAWVDKQRSLHPGADLRGNIGEPDYTGSDRSKVNATLEAPPLAKYAMTFDHIKPENKKIFTLGQATSLAPLIDFCQDAQQVLAGIKGYDIKEQFDVTLNAPDTI
jgi:hypothetical protein